MWISKAGGGAARFFGKAGEGKGLKKAVLVVPGFLGSRLYAGEDIIDGGKGKPKLKYAKGERLWIYNPLTEEAVRMNMVEEKLLPEISARFDEDSRVEALRCGNGGESIHKISTGGIDCRQAGERDGEYGTAGTYTAIVKALKSEFKNAWFLPYDWRLGVKAAVEELRPMLDAAVAVNDEAYIIAHSMGGLAALLYAKTCRYPEKLRLITLGTPFYGAPGALRVMQSGKALPLGFCSKALKKIAGNIQSGYDLLPTEKYGGYIVENSGGPERELTLAETAGLLESEGFGLNKILLNRARALHEELDAANQYSMFEYACAVIGTGKETPVKAHVSVMSRSLSPAPQFADINAGGGDGTVTVESATMRGAIPGEKLARICERHSKLPENRAVIKFVISKIYDWGAPLWAPSNNL